MYFIDNFKLQDYEGPKQLLLLYHYLDTDAAELVQKYADGVSIKGVAARGSEDFPSNAAFRYGAWSADADVIARWEFDDWHDPSRLSMQVRAMAATSRPACMLESKSDQSKDTKAEEAVVVGETSLAGDRSWMKVYWQPLPAEESANLVPPPATHVVHLDIQNSQIKSDSSRIQSISDTSPQAKVEAVRETKPEGEAVHEYTMKECLDLDNFSTIPLLTSDAEAKIDKTLGHGMSKMFHKLMARRHDITQKLQLLCMETTMESDMPTHIFKRQHVEEMAGIRIHLDKHIEDMLALFVDEKQLTASKSSK